MANLLHPYLFVKVLLLLLVAYINMAKGERFPVYNPDSNPTLRRPLNYQKYLLLPLLNLLLLLHVVVLAATIIVYFLPPHNKNKK